MIVKSRVPRFASGIACAGLAQAVIVAVTGVTAIAEPVLPPGGLLAVLRNPIPY